MSWKGAVAIHLPIVRLKPALGCCRYRDVNPVPASPLTSDIATEICYPWIYFKYINFKCVQQTKDKLIMLDVLDTMVTTVVPAPCPVRLVFLDCGITASLSSPDLKKFTEVFTAVVKGEVRKMVFFAFKQNKNIKMVHNLSGMFGKFLKRKNCFICNKLHVV